MDKQEIFKKYKMAKMEIQLEEVYLEEVNIDRKSDLESTEYINEIQFSKRIDPIDESSSKGYLKTDVLCRNSTTNNIDIEISVVYSGVFKALASLDKSQLESFIDVQLVPQLLSYSRTLITNLTSQMDIPPIQLPTMDVLESLKENDEIKEQGGE